MNKLEKAIRLNAILMATAEIISEEVFDGTALDGDATVEIAKFFLDVMDVYNGNISEDSI